MTQTCHGPCAPARVPLSPSLEESQGFSQPPPPDTVPLSLPLPALAPTSEPRSPPARLARLPPRARAHTCPTPLHPQGGLHLSPSHGAQPSGTPQEASGWSSRGLPTLTVDCDPFLGVEKAFCGHSGSQAGVGSGERRAGSGGPQGQREAESCKERKPARKRENPGEKREETWLHDSPAGPVLPCHGEDLGGGLETEATRLSGEDADPGAGPEVTLLNLRVLGRPRPSLERDAKTAGGEGVEARGPARPEPPGASSGGRLSAGLHPCRFPASRLPDPGNFPSVCVPCSVD